jgi:hypothetical protein
MLSAISDDGHRIYHMLIRHGLRFGCNIIIGVYSHVSGRFTCFEHVTSFMKSATQMAEERSSHDFPTNECALIQWCIRMNPGPDSSEKCCRGIRCDHFSRTSDRAFCPLRRHQYPGTKLPLPTARQCTVAPELEGGLAPAPKGGLNGAGGPIGIYTVYIYDDSVNRILLERRGTLWVLLELGNATQAGIALLRGK